MDTIIIANESLKHASDSIHVLMPDSIHTWQQVVTQKPDYSKYYSILSSLIIAVAGFILVERREAKKEKHRLDKLETHFLTWLNIIKTEIISQAFTLRIYSDNIFNSKYSLLMNKVKYDVKEFPFEQILELDKVDLTEILIVRHRKEDKDKLYLLNTVNTLSKTIAFYEAELRNEYNEKIVEAKNSYTFFYGDLKRMLERFGSRYENALKYLDLKYYSIASVYKNSIRLRKLLQAIKSTEDISEFYEIVDCFNSLFEWIKTLEHHCKKFIKEATNLEGHYLISAFRLDLLEKYYSNIINEVEFLTENNAEPKMLEDKFYSQLGEWEYNKFISTLKK